MMKIIAVFEKKLTFTIYFRDVYAKKINCALQSGCFSVVLMEGVDGLCGFAQVLSASF